MFFSCKIETFLLPCIYKNFQKGEKEEKDIKKTERRKYKSTKCGRIQVFVGTFFLSKSNRNITTRRNQVQTEDILTTDLFCNDSFVIN